VPHGFDRDVPMKPFALLLVLYLAACHSQGSSGTGEAPWEHENPLLPVPKPPFGTQVNFAALKFKVTAEKARLGRWLFFDVRLSGDGQVSCGSCHMPDYAFSQPMAHGFGAHRMPAPRKTLALVNVAWPLFPIYFWDGHSTHLAEQAKGPIADPHELGNTLEKAVQAIAAVAGYRPAFRQAYGDDHVDIDRIAESIAAYEATRVSGNSAFDRFDAGDASALTAEQKQGRDLFFGKAGCNRCHLGWQFSDTQFHNLGVSWDPVKGLGPDGKPSPAGFADLGRGGVTGKLADTGAFKTPSLRDVSKHGPYMHDGSIRTLRAVVEHYNQGGVANPWLDPKMHPLHLTTDEVRKLVAFLEALDGEGYGDTVPKSFPQ
jgi:cytochrome c peroxidase